MSQVPAAGRAATTTDWPRLELLIFLSAILTALTGAVTGARVEESRPVASASVSGSACTAERTVVTRAITPVAHVTQITRVALALPFIAVRRIAAISPLLFWSRRRE